GGVSRLEPIEVRPDVRLSEARQHPQLLERAQAGRIEADTAEQIFIVGNVAPDPDEKLPEPRQLVRPQALERPPLARFELAQPPHRVVAFHALVQREQHAGTEAGVKAHRASATGDSRPGASDRYSP